MLPFKSVPNDSALLQGDILRWHKEDSQPYGEEFSLVLNADCDLFTGKIPHQITVLPIVTLKYYTENIWPQEEFPRFKNRVMETILSDIKQFGKRENSEFSGISDELFEEILNSSDPEAYLKGLPYKNEKEQKQFKEKIDCAIKVRKLELSSEKDRRVFFDVCELTAKFTNQKTGISRKKILDRVKNKVIDSGQLDVFWISEMPETSEVGFIIPLRYPRMIPIDSVTIDRSRRFEDEDKSFRIGRLVDQFRYAIAEKFASQYHRIGLPNEYESLRKNIVPQMLEALNSGE